jgi:hypothetical protein
MDPFESPLTMIAFILGAIYSAFVAAIPFMIYYILRELRKITQKLPSTIDQSPIHQTKLLTEIRDALKSMEAVGIEVEQPTEPEYTLPPVPQSIGPRRHPIRTS